MAKRASLSCNIQSKDSSLTHSFPHIPEATTLVQALIMPRLDHHHSIQCLPKPSPPQALKEEFIQFIQQILMNSLQNKCQDCSRFRQLSEN